MTYVVSVWLTVIITWTIVVIARRIPLNKGLERLPVWLIIATVESVALLMQEAALLAAFLLIATSIAIFEVLKLLPNDRVSYSGLGAALVVAWLSSSRFPILAILMILVTMLLFTLTNMKQRASVFLVSAAYGFILCLPFVLFLNEKALPFVIVMLMLVHTADVSAGFIGKTGWGRPFPYLSPNKTWSGLIGSALCVIGMSVLLTTTVLSGSANMAVLFGVIVWVTAVVGDLAGSKIKRLANIKDFSSLLGPHGGVADRTDSLLFSAPLAVVLISLVSS